MNDLPTRVFESSPPPGRAFSWRGARGQAVRVGIVADVHFADRAAAAGRHYRDALAKLDDAVDRFRGAGVGFVIELGDLKDGGGAREETLSLIDRAEERLRRLGKDVYHVLGNHDTDNISKADFLARARNPGDACGKGYYSFERDGVTFVVLDANFREDEADYDSGDFDWRVAVVPARELAWLEKELAGGDGPVVVAVHQPLAGSGDIPRTFFVSNAGEVNRILARSGRVVAVFQGHHHEGDVTWRDGVPCVTFPGMIVGPYPETAFAIAEIAPDLSLRVEFTGRRPPGA